MPAVTRRELLTRLAWLPLLGPALTKLAAVPADIGKLQLGPVRSGVVFTRVGGMRSGEWASTRLRLGPDYRFLAYKGNDIVQGRQFALSTFDWGRIGWRGWIENGRGQVIAFVDRSWAVWGTP